MKATEAELKILIALLLRGGRCRAGTEWWKMRSEVDPDASYTDFVVKGFVSKDEADGAYWAITEAGKKAVEEATCQKS